VVVGDTEAPAVAYPALTGPAAAGDNVILNTTAVELGLGSGGFHIVVWNLSLSDHNVPGAGHIMKLRYTPSQLNVLAAEESASRDHERVAETSDLIGMPVIVGTLHSQLAPAAAVIKRMTGGRAKIAYIMTDGAALPIALSKQVRELKQKGLIDTTITIGQSFGGDLEAVNIFSGLAAAKAIAKADAVIVAMGVGIVGTNSRLGFSGIEQGQTVNAVFSMGGRAIAIPRVMFGDARERHQGLSEQTATALGIAAIAACDIALPMMDPDKLGFVTEQLEKTGLNKKHRVNIVVEDGTEDALSEYGLRPTTMGRGFGQEPEFFKAAGAAGCLAARMISAKQS
jgi:hypothetical protein